MGGADGGHCAFIGRPEEVREVVERAWDVAKRERVRL